MCGLDQRLVYRDVTANLKNKLFLTPLPCHWSMTGHRSRDRTAHLDRFHALIHENADSAHACPTGHVVHHACACGRIESSTWPLE
jgi:hypothetical protein